MAFALGELANAAMVKGCDETYQSGAGVARPSKARAHCFVAVS